jgi:hypothetical protein
LKTPHRTLALFLDVPSGKALLFSAPLIDGDFSQSGGLFFWGRTFGEYLLCHCLLPTSLLTKL